MCPAEAGEGAQQAIQVLVRMQRRNREQERFGVRRRAMSKKTVSTPSGVTRTFDSGSR